MQLVVLISRRRTQQPCHASKSFLAGIISKLDYIASLGVAAVWLSPIYKSPMADFGYDISDFRDIDPLFGTLDDFKTLVAEAKSRGWSMLIIKIESITFYFFLIICESQSAKILQALVNFVF